MSRNPHPHPLIFLPLLAGFVALFGVVAYVISPVPAYQQELTTTATAGEPIWVTTTDGRYPRPLPDGEQHWRQAFAFTGVNGERGFVIRNTPPGGEKPPAGETATVRYRPDPELAEPQQAASTPGRFADGVTLWSEGKWHFVMWLAAVLFTAAVGVVSVNRWRAVETIRTAHARGELTDDQVADQMANGIV